jgi:hypothetical protein
MGCQELNYENIFNTFKIFSILIKFFILSKHAPKQNFSSHMLRCFIKYTRNNPPKISLYLLQSLINFFRVDLLHHHRLPTQENHTSVHYYIESFNINCIILKN